MDCACIVHVINDVACIICIGLQVCVLMSMAMLDELVVFCKMCVHVSIFIPL